jgi:tRNA dimethylallyltransferase
MSVVKPAEQGPRIIAVVGPTAVGKTRLALRLAGELDAEILCADSRQVYRYLDVGTGKPTPAERAAAPHHLLDIVAPDEPFDAADFARLARQAIAEISARERPVIICGGTGLYIKALLQGLFPGPKADPRVRERLAGEYARQGAAAMHLRLSACDPEAAARLHPNDAVRVIRALEVAELTGRPLTAWHRTHRLERPAFSVMTLALWLERDALRRTIADRCAAMVADGLVDEVRGLWARGYRAELRPLQTLGYRHMGAHLRGELVLEEALEQMIRDTRRYAKRQLTWFRADTSCRWYHAAREERAALAAAERFAARRGD